MDAEKILRYKLYVHPSPTEACIEIRRSYVPTTNISLNGFLDELRSLSGALAGRRGSFHYIDADSDLVTIHADAMDVEWSECKRHSEMCLEVLKLRGICPSGLQRRQQLLFIHLY